MSVRQGLLAILDQASCYGYQLRAEHARRTGAARALNVGQIYNTLDRLERDGLVRRGEPDAQGHVFWSITDAGRDEVRRWFAEPSLRAEGPRDELAEKIALAATLPGVDVLAVLAAERDASAEHLRGLRDAQRARAAAAAVGDPVALAHDLVTEAAALRGEAEVRWLDAVVERLTAHPPVARQLALSADRPRRGRPVVPSS